MVPLGPWGPWGPLALHSELPWAKGWDLAMEDLVLKPVVALASKQEKKVLKPSKDRCDTVLVFVSFAKGSLAKVCMTEAISPIFEA